MMSSFISLAAVIAGAMAFDAPADGLAIAPEAPAAVHQAVARAVPAPGPVEDGRLIRVQDEVAAPETDPLAPPPDAPPALPDPAAAEQVPPPEPAPPQRSVISPPITSEQPSPTEQRAILKAVSGALSGVETARGRFIQVDPTGQLSEGSFALRRPGRMRFDYDDPVPILIAADGATVAIRDDELETVDRVPLAATPLALLLDDELDFETDAEVREVRKANGLVTVRMRDRTGEADGELTLIFDAASYELIAWRTLDANGGLTSVQLSGVQTDIRLDPRLFIIEDFEDDDEDRR